MNIEVVAGEDGLCGWGCVMKHRAFVLGRCSKVGCRVSLSCVVSLACLAVDVLANSLGVYASDVLVSGPLYVGCQGASNHVAIPSKTRVQAGSVFIGWNDLAQEGRLEVSADARLVVTDACSRPAACEVRRGVLWLQGGEVVSDSVSVWQNSKMGGRGTVSATTLCAGTLLPGAPIGTLIHRGALALSPSASSEFQIGGYNADSEFDRVLVDGRLCLAGVLSLSVESGFVPVEGDRFVIMTGSSVSGSFSDVVISNCPDGLAADVVVTEESVSVVFTAR